MCEWLSVIPRLFPPPILDCLQYWYANMGGKAWEIWSHVVMSGRQRVDTWGAGPDSNNSHQNVPSAVNNEQYWCCLANALDSSPQTDSTRKGFKILHQAPPPCVCHLSTGCNCMRPDLQASPLRICMLQAIKYWRWEWPGNEAKSFTHQMALWSSYGQLWFVYPKSRLLTQRLWEHCKVWSCHFHMGLAEYKICIVICRYAWHFGVTLISQRASALQISLTVAYHPFCDSLLQLFHRVSCTEEKQTWKPDLK